MAARSLRAAWGRISRRVETFTGGAAQRQRELVESQEGLKPGVQAPDRVGRAVTVESQEGLKPQVAQAAVGRRGLLGRISRRVETTLLLYLWLVSWLEKVESQEGLKQLQLQQ